ncbi:hypothetical protein Tco_1491304 [Tanacetum coccineum]
MDGQSERTIQTLEDMLRACVIDFGGSWELFFALLFFLTITIIRAFVVLLLRRYMEGSVGRRYCGIGLKLLEIVRRATPEIQSKLFSSAPVIPQRQTTDNSRKPFRVSNVGDHVMLKVLLLPWKVVVAVWKERKVSSKIWILQHDTFHVSNLKNCLADANLHVPLDEIKVDKTLRFVEEPLGW